jgi:hypothetical protein
VGSTPLAVKRIEQGDGIPRFRRAPTTISAFSAGKKPPLPGNDGMSSEKSRFPTE